MRNSLVLNQIKDQSLLITTIPAFNIDQLVVFKRIIKILNNNNNKLNFEFKEHQIESFTNELEIVPQPKVIKWFYILKFIIQSPKKLIVWYKRIQFKEQNTLRSITVLAKRINNAAKLFNSFDGLICWNPYCATFGVMADFFSNNGRIVYTFEYGPIPGGLMIDKGLIVNSENLRIFPKITFPKKILDNNFKEKRTNAYKQKNPNIPEEIFKSRMDKVLILGLSEVDSGVYPSWGNDRKLFYPFFKNGLDAAWKLSKACSNQIFIYKPHPNHNRFQRDLQITDNLWIINGDTQKLIQLADWVVGNGTKVENDALLVEKPLINLGAGFCYHSGLSHVVNSIEEFRTLLNNKKVQKVKDEISIQNWFRYMQLISFHDY